MTSTWIALLRGTGTVLLLIGVGGAVLRILALDRLDAIYPSLTDLLHHLVLALLCFSAASVLKTLRRLDERTARQNAALRRLMTDPSDKFPLNERRPIDLAPVAPDWPELKPGEPFRAEVERKVARRRRLGTVDDIDMFAARLYRKRQKNEDL